MPLQPLSDPSGLFSRIKGKFTGLITFLILFSTLIGFNVLQTLTLLIKIVNPPAFRRINREMANIWWGFCDFYSKKLLKIEIEFSGDDLPMRENALVLPNHQEMSDIVVLFRLARQKGRLGDMKWFLKDILKYVPGIGWGLLFLDCLFIKRNWMVDKSHIEKVFGTILKYKIPLWLLTFVEGTRIKPGKLKSSQSYAEKSGRKPLKHVLIPRTKGFVITVENLRGHLDAVYDITIGYTEGVPTLWQWVEGYVNKVNVHVRRFELSNLPEGSEKLGEWLHECSVQKDDIMEHYYKNGAFPAS